MQPTSADWRTNDPFAGPSHLDDEGLMIGGLSWLRRGG